MVIVVVVVVIVAVVDDDDVEVKVDGVVDVTVTLDTIGLYVNDDKYSSNMV